MSIRNEIKAALRTALGASFYFEESPEQAAYPYRVGSFGSSFDDEVAEVAYLELDYWGQGKSTAALDDLIEADAGDGDRLQPTGLNKRRIALPSGYVALAMDGCVPVEDPDRTIRHRRVTYSMRIYREG